MIIQETEHMVYMILDWMAVGKIHLQVFKTEHWNFDTLDSIKFETFISYPSHLHLLKKGSTPRGYLISSNPTQNSQFTFNP
jgi:hypothetical protein